jgi:hypothetical protein
MNRSIMPPLRLRFALSAAALAAAAAMAAPAPAFADVICADGTVHTAVGTGLNPTASLGPGLAGCNSATKINLTGGPFWTWTGAATAAGGDRVSWARSWVNGFGYGQVTLDPNTLVVTPVSPEASITFSVSTTDVTSTSLHYTITWSGTDAGTAESFAWYSYAGTVGSSFVGDNTDLPNWSTLSNLLATDTQHGPWSETLQGTLQFPEGDEVILAVNGVAASIVPEPATWAMMLAGFAGLAFAGRRAWRTTSRAAV